MITSIIQQTDKNERNKFIHSVHNNGRVLFKQLSLAAVIREHLFRSVQTIELRGYSLYALGARHFFGSLIVLSHFHKSCPACALVTTDHASTCMHLATLHTATTVLSQNPVPNHHAKPSFLVYSLTHPSS